MARAPTRGVGDATQLGPDLLPHVATIPGDVRAVWHEPVAVEQERRLFGIALHVCEQEAWIVRRAGGEAAVVARKLGHLAPRLAHVRERARDLFISFALCSRGGE